MAKSKKRRGRDASDIAKRSLPRPQSTPALYVSRRRPPMDATFPRLGNLLDIEDRRQWRPEAPSDRPVRLVTGHPHHRLIPRQAPRLVPKLKASGRRAGRTARFDMAGLPYQVQFATPERVAVCVRRKRRKEVMFATKKAGRTGQRKPRRNYNSGVSC